MKKILVLSFMLFSLLILASMFNTPASAAPEFQATAFFTPTPQDDGRILYIVQEGDTLWRIASISGITVDELKSLNQAIIGANDAIQPGDQLLLGVGGPVEEPTAALVITPLDLLTPSPTAGLSTGTICVLLFDDENGDSLRQESEVSIPDGAISVTERNGLFSETKTTELGSDETCFEEVPVGTYNITVAIPEGYNPTTALSTSIELEGGDIKNLRMGAQISAVNDAAQETPVEEGGRSPMLGIFGTLFILGGIGMGVFAVMRSRKPLKFER